MQINPITANITALGVLTAVVAFALSHAGCIQHDVPDWAYQAILAALAAINALLPPLVKLESSSK